MGRVCVISNIVTSSPGSLIGGGGGGVGPEGPVEDSNIATASL